MGASPRELVCAAARLRPRALAARAAHPGTLKEASWGRRQTTRPRRQVLRGGVRLWQHVVRVPRKPSTTTGAPRLVASSIAGRGSRQRRGTSRSAVIEQSAMTRPPPSRRRAARSSSPAETCAQPNSCSSRAHCVPLPAPGPPRQKSTRACGAPGRSAAAAVAFASKTNHFALCVDISAAVTYTVRRTEARAGATGAKTPVLSPIACTTATGWCSEKPAARAPQRWSWWQSRTRCGREKLA